MILGIDYGLKNIGLAISEGLLAEPKETLKIKNTIIGLRAIEKKVHEWGIEKIVIGISEGKSKIRALSFGKKLENMLDLPVEFADETLSTYEANASGRKNSSDHSKAAAIILQRYLDSI